jgi:hypothetical protein
MRASHPKITRDSCLAHGASFCPLKWIVQGMRSVFLPEQAATLEKAGAWEHGRIAPVLVV